MVADPKPAPRPKKTPKPIARKRAKPRRVPKGRCADDVHTRCKRIALHIGRCGTHADEYLLRLRADWLRKPACELARFHEMTNTKCRGVLQDNHGISRGYTRGNLRYTGPGFWGCGGANATAYYRPLEWRAFLMEEWGKERYEELEQLALHGPKEDHEKALADLIALSGQREGKA